MVERCLDGILHNIEGVLHSARTTRCTTHRNKGTHPCRQHGSTSSAGQGTTESTLQDPAVGMGEFASSVGGDVTWLSHLCPDGVIGKLPYEGAPRESQMQQDHTRLLMCMVQDRGEQTICVRNATGPRLKLASAMRRVRVGAIRNATRLRKKFQNPQFSVKFPHFPRVFLNFIKI